MNAKAPERQNKIRPTSRPPTCPYGGWSPIFAAHPRHGWRGHIDPSGCIGNGLRNTRSEWKKRTASCSPYTLKYVSRLCSAKSSPIQRGSRLNHQQARRPGSQPQPAHGSLSTHQPRSCWSICCNLRLPHARAGAAAVAVLFTAWGSCTVPVSPSPRTGLTIELPLLAQYLHSNAGLLAIRCYGVSAGAADAPKAAERQALADQLLHSERIQITGPDCTPL